MYKKAAESIINGGVVVVATETFYALAANPFDPKAVDSIFTLKNRPHNKTLPLIAASRSDADLALTNKNPIALVLMDKFWPGSLTLVMEAQKFFPGPIINDVGKIAVRVPPDCPARRLARLCGGWITSTSANESGSPPVNEVSGMSASILERVDFVLDTGPAPGGAPSTILEPMIDEIVLLREGAVDAREIEKTIGISLRKN